jgi:plastocyanin
MRKIVFIALVCFVSLNIAAQNTTTFTVILRSNIGTDTMWDGNTMRIFGMAPALSAPVVAPARTLYCNEGDSLVLHAYSISQNEHHTVHLHGMDADTRNDGDPMTSFWLNHMEDTTYSVRATNAGTYFYHCHVADIVHQQMGMYGFVVVRAAGGVNTAWTGGPAFSQDYNWMLAEYDEQWHDSIPYHDPIADTVHVPPYIPDYFLVNGHAQQEFLSDDSTRLRASVNEPVYIRLGNMGYCNDRVIFPASLQARIIDSDGRPLPNILFTDTLQIAPGESYGVLLIPTAEFTGVIEVHYENMNTGLDLHTEFVPVDISGFYGINDAISNSGCALYPNPATSSFNISFDRITEEPLTVQMFSVDGKLVFASIIPAGTNTATVNPIAENGMYTVVIRGTASGSLWIRKVQLNN